MDDGVLGGGTNWQINHKAQVYTKYVLLERIATTLEVERGDRFVQMRKPSSDPIHDKLLPVVKVAKQWAMACDSITQQMCNVEDGALAVFSNPVPPELGGQQLMQFNQIRLLLNAGVSQRKASFHNAEYNLQLVAFMLSWHATVSSLPVH